MHKNFAMLSVLGMLAVAADEWLNLLMKDL
jgi:hypothetical protein